MSKRVEEVRIVEKKITREMIYHPFGTLNFTVPPSGRRVSSVNFSPPLAKVELPFMIYILCDQINDLELVLYNHDKNISITSFDILYQGIRGETILVEEIQALSFALRVTNLSTATLTGSCYITVKEYL
ncbi:MAG: hypothetical protein DDT23_01367 [candidate division WS2 bacterium]|nr:hypothetical protein [Candidatus Lithacetigena glycinireducens]